MGGLKISMHAVPEHKIGMSALYLECDYRSETGNPVGTHSDFCPSTSGSPPTPSGAPPRSRQSVNGRRLSSSSGLESRRRRSRTQPSGLEETLNRVEVRVVRFCLLGTSSVFGNSWILLKIDQDS